MERPVFIRDVNDPNYIDIKEVPVGRQTTDIGGGIRRMTGYEDKFYTPLFPGATTSYAMLKRAVSKFGDRPAVGYRPKQGDSVGPFTWFSYNQFNERITKFSAGLRALGLQPKEHLGLYSKNRIEWQIAAQASAYQSFVSIALYDTLGEESSEYILNHGEVKILVVSDETFPKTAKFLGRCQYLKVVVSMDPVSDNMLKLASDLNIRVLQFAEVEALGLANPVPDTPPTPEDLSVIMYTSGTTGVPKGVMITHANMVASTSGIMRCVPPMNKNDVFLSFLPLAHILERVAEDAIFSQGGCIGYYQGDVRKILDDIMELKPTIMAGVPRIYDRIYEKSKATIETSGGFKKYLISKAFDAKKSAIENNGSTPIWDWLVFSKFKARVGGNMRGMISGGAPLKPDVQEFLRTAFGCPIVQGYGLTETTAGGTVQLFYDISSGSVGPPVPTVEIKLVDVPELNYLTTNNPPTGEVWIRGPCVSKGYYKEKEKTDEVFDADGWFHTGDIGRWNASGTLSIIDRKKNIFKLAQGEYVAAENIENILLKGKWLSQLFVYGDSFKTSIVGIGVLNPDMIIPYAKENNINPNTIQDLAKNPAIHKLVFDDLSKVAKENGLKGFEMVKGLYLEHDPFSPDNNLTTPTLKIKRPELKQKYLEQIEEMYKNIKE